MLDINCEQKNIEIKNLSLWDENARFPDKYFNQTEEELVNYFLSKSEFKIKGLTSSIVEDFAFPPLEKLVVYDDGGSLIVLEGNRRLTAYKLLVNPSIIKNNDSLKDFFEQEKAKINITENYELECLVTDDKEVGLKYIDRKHTKGNNEVGWGDTERSNYNKRRGKAKKDELLKIAISKIIKDLELPEAIKEKVLGKGFVTTFYRIINSSPAWQFFGYQLSESGELKITDPNFNDKLKVIVMNVLDQKDFNGKKINSRSLNKNEEIEDYLRSIQKDDTKKVDIEIEKNTSTDIFGEQRICISSSKANTGKCNPKSTSRDYLIPKSCILIINEAKINNIYHELKDDLLIDDSNKSVPNAVGILFRVFLEISIDYLLTKDGQSVGYNDKLTVKIPKVVEILKNKGGVGERQLRAINKVGSSSSSSTNVDFLSIENFHQYVHSFKEQPTPSSMKLKWDMLEEFFVLLWEYINKIEQKKKPII